MPPAPPEDAPPSRLHLPDWPRLMSTLLAAAYLSVSPSTLARLGIPSRNIGRRVLYDRRDIDRWADALSGLEADPTGQSLPADHQRALEQAESRAFFARRKAQGKYSTPSES